jgi:hypothetical protein
LIGEKMISSDFGGALRPKLQTPDTWLQARTLGSDPHTWQQHRKQRWIALFRITVDYGCFHCGLYCLGLLFARLFQNAWEWTQTHCTVDDTIVINCFHCGQHYKALGDVPLRYFGQELWLEALHPLPKAVGSG